MASEIPGTSLERYELTEIESANVDDEFRYELSQQIRNQELYAFVEISADVLGSDDPQSGVNFYSEASSISLARRWISDVISAVSRQQRIEDAGLQSEELEKFAAINAPVSVAGRGLMDMAADGSIVSSQEKDVMLTLFLPMGIMMFMFMVIFLSLIHI